jgi:hypothetical protein
MYNDPGFSNTVMNVGSLLPEELGPLGPALGELGIVGDVGAAEGWFVTKYVMTPMVDAIPGEEGNPVNEQGVQVPMTEEGCVLSGDC